MALILLDRDGVINESPEPYVTRWDEFRFLPAALEGLLALRRAGFRLAVVTNQSAVGRGLMSRSALDKIHDRMLARCADADVTIEAVFACPHAPWHGCTCRKPAPGLLRAAMSALGEPPEECVAIGDSEADLLAAHAASVPFVLVRTGHGEETFWREACRRSPPLFVARDLRDAAAALASFRP
jgi:D-glycero-D-manno-heptose 1,7-bisphosphate phosphatase